MYAKNISNSLEILIFSKFLIKYFRNAPKIYFVTKTCDLRVFQIFRKTSKLLSTKYSLSGIFINCTKQNTHLWTANYIILPNVRGQNKFSAKGYENQTDFRNKKNSVQYLT